LATTVYSFAEGDLKLRYREPYLSDSLNTKFQRIVAAGVYAGFIPSVTGAPALGITLLPDSYGSAAVATSSANPHFQVSIHVPTTLSVDLTTSANKTVALVLEASFNRPSVSSATLKAYDLTAGETVPSYAITLCRVVVPAAGAIPAGNVTLTGRTLPWETRGRDAVPFVDIVKNGTFHFFTSGQTNDLPAPYWKLAAGTGTLAVVNTIGPEGVNDNVLVATAVAGANTTKVSQPATISVTPASMRVRVKAQYQQVVALATGNAAIKVYFRNANNPASVTDTVTLPLTMPVSGSLGTWYSVETLVTVAATSSDAKYLASVEIDFNGSTWASTGAAFRVTNVSVAVEQGTKATDLLLENTTDLRATSLRIVDVALTGPNAGYALAYYTDSTNTLSFSDETGGAVCVVLTGRLDAGSVYAPFIDYAGAISLGTTDATAISIGKTGVTATVGGNLVVSGSATFSGALVVSSIDSTGALNIGTTTQTALTLGRSAVNTTISGAVITIASDASFAGDLSVSITKELRARTITTSASSMWVKGGSTALLLGNAGVRTVALDNLYVNDPSLTASDDLRVMAPAYAGLHRPASEVALTATTSYSRIAFTRTSKGSRNTTSTTGALANINGIPAGDYAYTYSFTGWVSGVSGTPLGYTARLAGTNVQFDSGGSATLALGLGMTLTANLPFSVSGSGVLTVTADNGVLYAEHAVGTGTSASVEGNYYLTLHRVGAPTL
jgi:hypothetical protein